MPLAGLGNNVVNDMENLVKPWTKLIPVAKEDEETELPCSFPDFLAFTEIDYEASIQVYYDSIDIYVFPDFKKTTDIMQLLRTKGVKVLVPRNWE